MAGKKKLDKGPMLLPGLNLNDIDSLLDDGGSSSNKKRTPKESIRQFQDSARRTIKDRVNSKTVLASFMRTALPDGYLRLLGLYDEGKRGIETVIDGIEETEFANLESLAEKFEDQLPKLKGKLPDAVYERIKAKIEDKKGDYTLRRQIDNARTKQRSGTYDTEGEDAGVEQMFDDLAEAQLDLDKANSDIDHNKLDYDVKRDGIRARLDKSRFDVLNRHLGMIADSAQRNAAFNDAVTYQFQKKSLELQMRQYLALRSVVKLSNETLQLQRRAFTDLVHNTGLPEFMKSSDAERTKFDLREKVRNPFTNAIAKTSSDFAANFLPMLFNNIGSKGSAAVRGAGQFGDGGIISMLKRVMANPEENIGGLAGNEFANLIHRTLIPTLSRTIRPGIKKASDRLTAGTDSKIAYTLDNLSSITQGYANDASKSAGWQGKLQGLVKMFAPQFRNNDLVKTGTYQTIDHGASFNQMTQRSIVEIIPGYLSRLLQETRMIRTGDHTIGRESYDLTRGRFVDDATAKDNLSKRIVGMGARRNMAWTMNSTMGTFDSKGALSPEAKHALEERLLRDAMEGRHFDPEQYVRPDGYAPGTDPAVLTELEKFFKRKFRFNDDGKLKDIAANFNKRQEFSVRFNELRDSAKSPVAEIERLLASGNHTVLREMGIIHTVEGEDRINFAVLRDYYRDLGEGGPGAPPEVPNPADPKFRNLRKKLEEKNKKARESLSKMGKGVRRRLRDGGQRVSEVGGSARDSMDEALGNIRDMAGSVNTSDLLPTVGGLKAHLPTSDVIQEALNKGKQELILRSEELNERAQDLIVVGKNKVTIRAGEIIDGSLIDVRTQKVITSIKDIKGEVIDKIGNVRLTHAEVAAGLMTGSGQHLNILRHLPTRLPPSVMTRLADQRQSINSLIMQENGMMSRVKDLYLEGANDPVIKAVGIRAGEYIDINTKKVIETIDDITGSVANIATPDEVLFTAQEAATKLVDNAGKRFRSSKILKYLAWATSSSLNITGGLFKIGTALTRKVAMFIGKRLTTLDAYLPGNSTPILTSEKLKRGEYYHEDGGVIKSFDDLRNGVYSADGNLLVNPEDITNLINRDGTKHTAAKRRSMLRKLGKKLLIGAPMAAAKGLGRAWWKGTKAYYRGMGNMISKRFGKGVDNAEKYNDDFVTPTDGILGKILGVLNKRLPKEEAKAGSWEAKLAAANAAEQAKREGKKTAKKDSKKKSGGLLAGLMSLLGGKNKEEEEESGSEISLDFGGGDSDGGDNNSDDDTRDRRRRRRGRPRGRMGKAWDRIKGSKVGGAARGIAGNVGRAFGGTALAGLASTLGVDLAAIAGPLSMLSGVSLGGVGSALGAGAGMLGTGLATAGTALLGILGSPVVLGALAVGAVAAGGYWLWNRSSKVSGDFRELRLMQYGIDSTGDKLKVLELEAYLEQYATKGADPRLNLTATDPKKLFEIMGVDSDEPEEIVRFATWIDKRFKPVFFTWLKAMHQLTPTGTLINELEDKLPDEAKYDFFQLVKAVPKEVYGEMVNPLDEDPLEVDPADIEEKIKDLIDDWRDKAKAKDENKTGDTTGAVSSKPDGVKEAGKAGKGPSVLDRIKTGAKGLLMASPIGAAVVGLYKAVKDNWFGKMLDGVGSAVKTALGAASVLSGLGLKSAVAFGTAFKASKLTTLQAVRVRAYGRMQLDQKTIAQLFDAEAKLYEQVSYTSDGQAYFSGNLDVLMGEVATIFGVDVTDAKSRKAQEFTAWMLQRFIPVGLAYFAAVKQKANAITPSRVETALNDDDKLSVANAVMTATYDYFGDNNSIWKAETFFNNGFADLGSLKASAEVEVSKLKELVEKARLASPGTSVKEQENQTKSNTRTTAESILAKASSLGSALKEKFNSFTEGVKSTVGGAVNSVKDWLGMGGKTQTPANSSYSAAYSPGGSLEQRGSVFTGFAEGNGGIWNSIPLPKSNKSREAAMETLRAVQAMSGVDAELMATFCSIESNFDYLIKAPTSSATGWFQFINSTWDWMLEKCGSKYGIPPDNGERYLRKDPRINALMGAEFLKDNYKILAKAIGRAPTDTDLYAAHFFGAGTAASFLTKDQNAIGASFFPKQANANRGIFYKKTGQARTIGEVYALFESKVRSHRRGGGGQDVGKSPIGEPDAQKVADMQAEAVAKSADVKADDAVTGDVGTGSSSGTDDSIKMIADRAAAPMRMGDPSSAPTGATLPSAGGTVAVSSGQDNPDRKKALEEAANRAVASDKARTAEVKEKQAIAVSSIDFLDRQLTTQEQMRDLLKIIADRLGNPTVVPSSPTGAPVASGNDMGKKSQVADRKPGNSPVPVSFSR